jgi:DNA polymerase elongation subunit (family B)
VKNVKKIFWLLDVNSEVRDHNPEVWLWGIEETGSRVLILDRKFLTYFYLILDEKEDSEAIVERIKAHGKWRLP